MPTSLALQGEADYMTGLEEKTRDTLQIGRQVHPTLGTWARTGTYDSPDPRQQGIPYETFIYFGPTTDIATAGFLTMVSGYLLKNQGKIYWRAYPRLGWSGEHKGWFMRARFACEEK